MKDDVSTGLLQLWKIAVEDKSPRRVSNAEYRLALLRSLYRKNRTAFTDKELKVIDVAKVLLGLEEHISQRFIPRQIPDSSGNFYLNIELPDGRSETIIINKGGPVSVASKIGSRRMTHCFRCQMFLDEKDGLRKCSGCGWMICPDCGACGCEYVGETGNTEWDGDY